MIKLRNIIVYSGVCFISLINSYAQPRLVVPVGHTAYVQDAVFSPDSKTLATYSLDKTIKIWSTVSGKLLQTLYGNKDRIASCRFSPKGNYLSATGMMNTSISVWDTKTGELKFSGKKGTEVNAPVFSHNEKYVAFPAGPGFVILHLQTGDTIRKLNLPVGDGYFKGIHSICFSTDDKYILAATDYYNDSIYSWELSTGKLLRKLTSHNLYILDIECMPDNKSLLIDCGEKFLIRDLVSGNEKSSFQLNERLYIQVAISKNYKQLFQTISLSLNAHYLNDRRKWGNVYRDKDGDEYVLKLSITDLSKGSETAVLLGDHSAGIGVAEFDPNGRYLGIITEKGFNIMQVSGNRLDLKMSTESKTKKVWTYDIDDLEKWIHISPDSRYVVTSSFENAITLWDINSKSMRELTGSIEFEPEAVTTELIGASTQSVTSPDSAWTFRSPTFINDLSNLKMCAAIMDQPDDNPVPIFDSANKKWKIRLNDQSIIPLDDPDSTIIYTWLSPDKKRICTVGDDEHVVKVWDAANGRLLFNVKNEFVVARRPAFNKESSLLALTKNLAISSKELDKMWAELEVELNASISDTTAAIKNNVLQPVKDKVEVDADNKEDPKGDFLNIVDLESGKIIHQLRDTTGYVYSNIGFIGSSDYLFWSNSYEIHIWDAKKWVPVLRAPVECEFSTPEIVMSHNNKKIMITCGKTTSIFEAFSNKFLFTLQSPVKTALFNSNENYILTISPDNRIQIWNAHNGQLLFTYFSFEGNNFLVLDNYGRYDGTEKARKSLYYVCGDEIIDLDQIKALGWQPGLAGKIMGYDKEPITVQKISQINICNVTPVVEQKGLNGGIYQFIITPRSAGIGEVQLYVRVNNNEKLIKKYELSSLKKTGNNYLLSVPADSVKDFLVSGAENELSVKATIKNGTMVSRSGTVTVVSDKKEVKNPNVYLVSVGISQYKGNKLNLAYASKDATDFASALTLSARKLLNIDGLEHVTAFTFSTSEGSLNWPAKRAIALTLDSIAKKATADDIFIFFFAGHGVMKSEQKKLYLLTADASAPEIEGVEKEVAISFDELKGWMQKIKANKQLFILDACNSGQAVQTLKELMTKREVPTDQLKALDELKDNTGTYILSASASGQAAYETSLYGQGLLTYSLLSGIKLGNGLKDNKYIDVSNWFNTALRQVKAIATDIGGRQEPQIIGNASFNVGLVDKEVTDGISLSIKKKVFKRTTLLKEGRIPNDALGLSQLVDISLNEIAVRGKESPLSYIPDNTLLDAYSIRGYYNIQGNEIIVKISLVKGEEIENPLFETELKDSIENKAALAIKITEVVNNHLNK